mgnify:FL=1
MKSTHTAPEQRPARPASLPLADLARWLMGQGVLDAGQTLQAERITGGQSNPSWLLRSGSRVLVLRAKPAPAAQLLPSAHAIEREYRILRALQGTGVPVPHVRALCEDESVMGVAFYVMDFVQGCIFRDATLPEVPPPERAAYFKAANEVLARLHRVDWRALGLQDFGRHDGYYSRLIRRWTKQYEASRPAPVAAMEQLAMWLPQHIPAGADSADLTCITHGDYRIENLMFHPTRPEVVAVLDWELATLGHPLSDLSYSALAWRMPSGILRGYGDQDLTALGIPPEMAHVALYCERMHMDLSSVCADWPFYLAFNLFRLSAILFGIGQRERDGVASNTTAREIAAMAEPVARWGWAIAQGQTTDFLSHNHRRHA